MVNNMNFNNTPIDWDAVHSVINNANNLMLTTHENPDGDGLGSGDEVVLCNGLDLPG